MPDPTITWVGMTRPNYETSTVTRIRCVVMHATAGRSPSDFHWLRKGGDPRNPVSVHYYLDKAGRISQLVADANIAWHAGASRWEIDGEERFNLNALSLGIELSNLNNGPDPYPDAQYQSAVALARMLVQRYDVPRTQLVRHLDISPGRKTDPDGFPWQRFVADVYTVAPPLVTTPDSPLLGSATGTADQAIAWFVPRTQVYRAPDIGLIVRAYEREGAAVGLDWFLALAQCAYETGNLVSWWAARPRRNPAGLGVTGASVSKRVYAANPDRYPDAAWAWKPDDRKHEGLSFPRWDADAVRAHLGRLLAYALPAGQGTPAQQAMIAEALARRDLPADYRGVAPTLVGLNGRWAVPGTDYATRIAAVANAMRRAATCG